MKTLHTSMKEMETKKRLLEEAVDTLNEEVTRVRAEGENLHTFFRKMGAEHILLIELRIIINNFLLLSDRDWGL